MHLPFPERQYQRRSGWKGVIKREGATTPTVAELASAIRPQIESIPRVFAPAGLGHPDHTLVCDAVLEVRPDAVLYADMPYTLDEPGLSLPGFADRVVTEHTLEPVPARRKVEAIACYASQLDSLEAAFGSLLDPLRMAKERLFLPRSGQQ